MITQGTIDLHAKQFFRQLAGLTELITYQHKPSATEAPTTTALEVPALFSNFSARQIALEIVLADDLKCRIRRPCLRIDPTRFDVLVRDDASEWRVLNVFEGAAQPYWTLQVRRIL